MSVARQFLLGFVDNVQWQSSSPDYSRNCCAAGNHDIYYTSAPGSSFEGLPQYQQPSAEYSSCCVHSIHESGYAGQLLAPVHTWKLAIEFWLACVMLMKDNQFRN